jgi:hypothetical protein
MSSREGFTCVSFTSIPEYEFEQFKDIARKHGLFPRDLFSAALRQLLADRKSGTEIIYPASRRGGIKRAMWLEEDLVEELNAAATADKVSQTVIFLTALKRFAQRESIDAEVSVSG